jgi:hypothetical protein
MVRPDITSNDTDNLVGAREGILSLCCLPIVKIRAILYSNFECLFG